MSTPGERPIRLRPTTAFGRDLKRVSKRGYVLDRLRDLIERLRTRAPLEPRHRDHALTGDWKGWRDCHVEPAWILIYRVDDDAGELILGRTGTHADLFEQAVTACRDNESRPTTGSICYIARLPDTENNYYYTGNNK